MKTKKIDLVRYDADEGKVFDWVEPHYNDVPNDLEHPEQGTHQELIKLKGEYYNLYKNQFINEGIEASAR